MKPIKHKSLIALTLSCGLFTGAALAATHDLMISNVTTEELSFTVNNKTVPSFHLYPWEMTHITGAEVDAVCLQSNPCLIQAYRKSDNANVGGLASYNGGSFVDLLSGDKFYSQSISVGDTINQWFIVSSEK